MKDFEGFKNLFHRFLQVKGPSVEWIKIQRPPEDSVSVFLGVCASMLGSRRFTERQHKLIVLYLSVKQIHLSDNSGQRSSLYPAGIKI